MVQIIDLEDSSQECSPLSIGAISTTRLFGGLTSALDPMLCSFVEGECYVYDQQSWTLDETLNAKRIGAAACQSPFDGRLWMSGGHYCKKWPELSIARI